MKFFIKIITVIIILCIPIYYLLGTRSFTPEITEYKIERPEEYIKSEEAKAKNLKPDCEKKIIWQSKTHEKTKYSIVYIPGFSATRKEIYPIVETLSDKFKANAFLTRFPYHGERPIDFKNLKAQDFFDTASEAYEIGQRIGEKLIFIGTSTGAVMTEYLLIQQKVVHAAVLISPAYRIMPKSTPLLAAPLGELLNYFLVDEFRSWKPKNPEAEKYWNTSYHRDSLVSLAKAIYYVYDLDEGLIKTPTLMLYTKNDKVVSVSAILQKYQNWGSKQKMLIEIPSESHVLAGEVTSPHTTQIVIEEIRNWLDTIQD